MGVVHFLMLQCSIHPSTTGVTSDHETIVIVAKQNKTTDSTWVSAKQIYGRKRPWPPWKKLCATGSTFSLHSFRDAGGHSGHNGAHSDTVTHRHRDIDIIGTSKITLLKLNALPILLYFAHLEVSSTSSISIVSKSGR